MTSPLSSVTMATIVCGCLCLLSTLLQAAPIGEEVNFHGLREDEWREVEDIKAQINVIAQKLQKSRPKDIEMHEDENLNMESEDIRLTKAQALFLLNEVKEEEKKMLKQSGRVKRRAIVPISKRWTLPIQYMFDSSHDRESDKRIIRDAFQEITDHTCISFREIPRQRRFDGPFLNITNINRMCASFVGRADTVQGQGQDITLSSSCLKNKGTPVHEICHALGLWHEHQRNDRGNNINILYENIPFWARINFELAPTDNKQTDDVYDFNSVLQYGPQTSSINMEDTIEPLDSLYYQNMGQRVGLSFLDAKVLNNMYCSDECRYSYIQCRHGGYQDPKDCNQCRCPDGLGGRYCEQLAQSELDGSMTNMCGGEIDIRGYQWVQTPNYGYGTYPMNLACNWKFRVSPGQIIQLQFYDNFGVSSYNNKNIMCHHWIEVKQNSNNFGLPGYRFCGEDTPRAVIRSTGEEMVVTFRSLDLSSTEGKRGGVRLLVQAIYASDNNPTSPPQRTSTPRVTTRPTTSTSTIKVTTVPTTAVPTTTIRPPTTTISTPRPTTAVPTTTVPSTTTPSDKDNDSLLYVYSWTQWSRCQGDIYCSCGGCSFQTRRQLCNGLECPREHEKFEQKPCDRLCETSDTKYVYIGTLLSIECSQCCKGFELNPERTKCVRDRWSK